MVQGTLSRRGFFRNLSSAGLAAASVPRQSRSQPEDLPPGMTTGWGVPGAAGEITVGSSTQLLCDDFLISRGSAPGRDYPVHVAFNVAPVKKEEQPVMLPGRDAPWEKTGMYWVCVLQDGGRYRCWYNTSRYTARLPEYPHQRPVDKDQVVHMMVAYAESDDGITWRKPIVNLVDIDGSKANNVVFVGDTDRYTEGGVVFIDPTARSDERYKMVFASRFGLKGAYSGDGLRWSLYPRTAEVRGLDTQNVANYDPILRRYVAYVRSNALNYGGLDVGLHPVAPTIRGRAVARMESPDFQNWSPAEIVLAPDIQDGLDMDFYTCPCSRYQDVHFMLPSAYYHWSGKLNLQVAVSRDNRQWVRPTRATLVDNGGAGSYDEFRIYAGPGILPSGRDRLTIFTRSGQGPHPGSVDASYKAGPWKNWSGLPEGCMGRVMLKRERIVGIEARSEPGVFATRPLVFAGRRLRVNVEPIGPDPQLRVQLVQSEGRGIKLVPGRAFADSDPITADDLDAVVRWQSGPDLGPWSGRPVRLQFQLRSTRVYAFQFLD